MYCGDFNSASSTSGLPGASTHCKTQWLDDYEATFPSGSQPEQKRKAKCK